MAASDWTIQRGERWAFFGSDPLLLLTCPQNEFLGVGDREWLWAVSPQYLTVLGTEAIAWQWQSASGPWPQGRKLCNDSCQITPFWNQVVSSRGAAKAHRTVELRLVKLPHFTCGERNPRGMVTSHKADLPATR